MKTITTRQAEERYHLPAATFAHLCREDKLPGAHKIDGEWQIPVDAIEAYLATLTPPAEPANQTPTPGVLNPDPDPEPQSPLAIFLARLQNHILWILLGIIALIIGFTVDVISLWQIFITQTNSRVLFIAAAIITLFLGIGAIWLLQAKDKSRAVRRRRHKPSYPNRFTQPRLRFVATLVAWIAPIVLITSAIGYWLILPATTANQTVVLIADFIDPNGDDCARTTRSLIEGMRTHLVDHPAIVIEPLNQPIPAENGSETVRAIGQRPEHNASVIIWGDCTLTPDPELYVHFDILKDTTTYLQTGIYEQYGPAQIQQPTIFEFKLTLSEHLAQLTAFTAALALFEDEQHLAALSLFNTAAGAIGHTLGQDMERAIRFHRSTSYLYLGQAIDAKQDLELLIPDPENSIQRFDDIATASLGNLGLAYAQLGQVEEAIGYHEQAIAIAQQIGDMRIEGNQLGNLGIAYAALGQVEKAIAYYQQALAIAQQIGDMRIEGNQLGNLGIAYADLGQVEKAIAYYQQALAIAQQIGDMRIEGFVRSSLGLVYADLGQVEEAIGYHEHALAIAQQIGDMRSEGAHLGNLGIAYVTLGQVEEAIGFFQQAIAISQQISDKRGEGNHLGNLGNAYYSLGQVEQAIAYYQQALAIAQQIGDKRGEGNHLGNLGIAYADLGQVEQAIAYHEQALAISIQIGDKRGEGSQLGNLGNAYYSLGQVDEAIGYHEQALAISIQIGDKRGEGADLGNLGNAYTALGQVEQAIAYYQQALAIAQQIGDMRGEGNRLGNLGIAYADLGQVEQAIAYYQKALAIARQIGDKRGEGNHLANLVVCQIEFVEWEEMKQTCW